MISSTIRSVSKVHKALLTGGILLLCLALYVHFTAGDAGDKSWILVAARKWLDGKKLYVDIFEINPPLFIWIYSLPVYLSLHLGFLRDYQFLVVMGLAAIAFSTGVSSRLIIFHPEFAHDARKQQLFIVLLASVFIFFTNPIYFFDREHIFLILTFPYILRWMPSLSGMVIPLHMRVIIGVMAGVGFCMKPHCLLVLAGINLICGIMRRSLAILLCIENAVIYLIILSYLLSIWYFTPEYITVVLPMALAAYSATNARTGGILFAIEALFTFAVTFADFRLRYTSPYRKDIFYFVAADAAFLAYALANQGWGYTWNPLTSMILITTGFVWWEYIYLEKEYRDKGLPFRQFVFGARACLVNFAANSACTIIISAYAIMATTGNCLGNPGCEYEKKIVNEVEQINGSRSFGTISINFTIWAQLARQTGAEWQTRFYHLWMLPQFFASGTEFTSRNKWVVDYVADALAEDMKRNKPERMFVEDTDNFYTVHRRVDLIAYLSASPRFREAWRHYRYMTKIMALPADPEKDQNGYLVYQRID